MYTETLSHTAPHPIWCVIALFCAHSVAHTMHRENGTYHVTYDPTDDHITAECADSLENLCIKYNM